MFQTTAKMMGQDAFAKALHDKLLTLSGSAGLLNWQNMQGLNEALSNPGQAQHIRKLIMQALPYMSVVSLKQWLTNTEKLGDNVMKISQEIEATYGSAIDQKTADAIAALGLDPQQTQDAQRALRSQVSWAIAA